MVMINCPHCGKPLRPGSRFCGNCGNAVNIPVAQTAAPQQISEASQEAAAVNAADENDTLDWLPCPNCGKPVRPGAKFCQNCGQAISADLQAQSEPVLVSQPNAATMPVSPFIENDSAGIKKEVKPGVPPKRASRTAIPLLLSGILLACVAAISGGYIYLRDPFNWFTTNPLAMATHTATVLASPSRTIVPTELGTSTVGSATLSPTKTLLATFTPTEKPTETLAPTTTVPQPEVLLVDDFDGSLNEQWVVWLAPTSPFRPKIDTGPGENYLYLMAGEDPSEAGVTSKVEIPNVPGLDIQFIGQLMEDFPNHVLLLDWDPIDVERGPLSILPGEIHLEIWRDRLIFSTVLDEAEPCQTEIVGFEQHTYHIAIEPDQDLVLYVDGSEAPVCVLRPGFGEPKPGLLTFTGIGWITKVQVTAPPE